MSIGAVSKKWVKRTKVRRTKVRSPKGTKQLPHRHFRVMIPLRVRFQPPKIDSLSGAKVQAGLALLTAVLKNRPFRHGDCTGGENACTESAGVAGGGDAK